MERGLAKEFALFRLSPDEVTRLTGIKFEITQDNIDYCKGALLSTMDGHQFALRSYYRGPNPGVTELIGSERSKDPRADATKFLEALEIPSQFILATVADSDPEEI